MIPKTSQDIHGPWRLGTTHLGLQDGTHPLRNLPSAGCSGGESSHAHWEVWENVFGTPWESFGNPLGTPWDTHFGQFTSPFLSGLLVRWPTSWSPWQNLSAGRRSSTILVRWSRCSRWEYAGHMSYVNLSSTYVRMHGYVWICMYVCLYLYIWVCMYIYLYIYIWCVCMYIYIWYTYECINMHLFLYLHNIYIYGHLHLHTHIFLYIHVYMIIYVYIHCNEVLTWQGSTWLWSAPWIRWPKTYHATDRSW